MTRLVPDIEYALRIVSYNQGGDNDLVVYTSNPRLPIFTLAKRHFSYPVGKVTLSRDILVGVVDLKQRERVWRSAWRSTRVLNNYFLAGESSALRCLAGGNELHHQ